MILRKLVILSALTLSLVGCTAPIEATDGSGAEYEKLDTVKIKGHNRTIERALYIHTETKCVYTKYDDLVPVAEQEYEPVSGKCIGYYQDRYDLGYYQ